MATVADSDLIKAAGGVPWRRTPDGTPEIALVHRPKYDDWSLPKGKLVAGEHPLAAAVREIEEETGYQARLSRPLPTRRYQFGDRPKEVRYWSAEVTGGAFTPNNEVDRLDWLPPDAARDRLSQPGDAEVLDAMLAGPVGTTPLLVLRHSAAVPREEWEPDDDERPLSDEGEQQTAALLPLLCAYRPAVVFSSPARRCLDTVRPYADRHRVTVQTDPLYSEKSFVAAPETAVGRAAALLSGDTGALICTHRPVLPGLLAGLGVQPPSPRLRPGEFVVVHHDDGRITEVEQHGP